MTIKSTKYGQGFIYRKL
jgi:DNA-binding MarR family transcriptional regulator